VPCNCGSKNPAQKFLYTGPDGNQTVYTTEVQARAAQIRNGGKGTITKMAA
jgi:hypothetical protein